MAHSFTHSRVVIRQLAQATARTPPSEEDPPFEYVDRSLTILGRSSNIHSERLRQEFLSQREFIATQIKEVEIKIDGRFKEMENKMDGRFKEMDGRFKEVDGRFKEVDQRLEETDKKIDRHFKELDTKIEGVDKRMRDYLNLIQNASRNYLRTRGWEAISPVGSLDPQGGMHLPEYFPRTIRHFWRLRDSSQMDRLIHLIRFYKIQGYEEWGRDTDSLEGYSDSDDSSEESSESSRLPIPLEVAVRSNPDIAHQALGAQLGLAYNEIQRFMERAKELSQVQIMRNKRGQEEEASEDRRKRSFKMSPEGTEVTSPTEPQSSQGR